uniref:Uncharacterized protein n=1 Tax=Oryza rufipogon TaxID=4529 RepID=A0A0E0P888_ORYRU
MEHRGAGTASLAGWRIRRGGSCHHRCRHCCWWRRGWSRGEDREAVREVPKHMMEAELLTTFQEVAIVDEVTVIKDKRPLVATPARYRVQSRVLAGWRKEHSCSE